MGTEGLSIRGVTVTDELYDLILFVVHSFVRPTTTELYALRHNDVEIAENPKRLIVTVRNGKNGYRMANTLPACVSVYQRIKQRYPEAKGEDYLFLPNYLLKSDEFSFVFLRRLCFGDGRRPIAL